MLEHTQQLWRKGTNLKADDWNGMQKNDINVHRSYPPSVTLQIIFEPVLMLPEVWSLG